MPPTRLSRGQRTPVDAVDRQIADRLRARREQLRIDAAVLDLAIGARPGTLKRFESAIRPIPASLLFRLATLLDVDVAYFFADENGAAQMAPLPAAMAAGKANGAPRDLAEAKRFLSFYTHLQDPDVRRQVRDLVRSIAEGQASTL